MILFPVKGPIISKLFFILLLLLLLLKMKMVVMKAIGA